MSRIEPISAFFTALLSSLSESIISSPTTGVALSVPPLTFKLSIGNAEKDK